ncbi:MAG TPA: GerMN domain-containing protein [Jiangellales bacterium]|nr:GerMN domain-containing protein [Jiangellales bacterium]
MNRDEHADDRTRRDGTRPEESRPEESRPEVSRPEETPLEDTLRRALDEEAATVPVGEDGLDRILQRAHARGRERRWAPALAAAAAVAVAAGVGVAVLTGDDDPVTTTPEPLGTSSATATPSPTPSPSDVPTPTPAADGTAAPAPAPGDPVTVPAYYVTDTAAGLRLAREFRTVPEVSDPVRTALQTMLAGPVDPDYASLWNPAAEVLGVEVGEVIEVDLSAEATRADVGAEAAELAVQQLVYTATAAAQRDDAVRILVGGRPVDELFGHVDVSEPVRRSDPLSVRLLVQLNDPGEAAVVGRRVRVSGEAAAFEATVPWRVLRDGVVVREGFATAEDCCRLAPFAFEVELEPGTYELVVTEDDPSGGEGRPPMSDTKTFTVQG